jgi:uncharacterized integral membrane protein
MLIDGALIVTILKIIITDNRKYIKFMFLFNLWFT